MLIESFARRKRRLCAIGAVKLEDHLQRIERGMDFTVLYNETRHLFTIGFNLSMGRLDNSYYDLLASEAALTSFLTIARGEAHRRHWFQLGRPITRVGETLALVSWGGTMFEYLMPRLFLRSDPQTLLDETRRPWCDDKSIMAGNAACRGAFRNPAIR